MNLKERMIAQFRRPHGPVGVLVGRFMSKRSSNRQRSEWTVGLLELRPDDRVLELGYGPGVGIEAALAQVRDGRVVGLDHSETMQAMATKRARSAGGTIEPELLVGDAASLPADLGTFDKIFSCNVWLFWDDPVAVLRGLRRHLAPGGTMAVTHLPRHGGSDRATTMAAGESIAGQLAEAGYGDIRHHVLDIEPVPAVCVLATNL